MQYLREAAERAPDQESQALARELAQLASGPDGDLEVAAETYARLLEREPADRSLWEPMLHVLMRRGDRAQLQSFVAHTLSALLMVEDRVFMQLAYANYLLGANDDNAAAGVLRQLLEEDPAHLEATDKLLALYQRHGMQEELSALLQQQFDRARDERNVSAICELGLRLAALYGESHPEQACDALRAALEWEPEHRELLTALLTYLPDDTDPRDRVELTLRVLKTERGPEAAQTALDLAARCLELGMDERVGEALEYGYQAYPEDERVREKLESYYAERALWRPLAELMQREAARLGSGMAAIARLKNAASLYRDQLQDVEGAAAALRAALAFDPNDLSLLGELARNLAAAGQHAAAIDDVTRLLDGHPDQDDGRVALLRVRAELHQTAGMPFEALADIEEAHTIVGESVMPELLATLAHARDAARESGAGAMARSVTLRLCELYDARGEHDLARAELDALSELLPEDVEILGALRQRDLAAERYADVAKTSQRMVALTQGEARVDAVLGLAEAHERMGHGEAALPWLLRVHEDAPDVMPIRDRLRELYGKLGQHRDLAVLLMGDAEYREAPSDKLACWLRAAELFVALGEPETAVEPLQKAMALAPDDDRTRLLLVDIDLALGRVDEATASVEHAIQAHKRRRSPELAQFQQRMARICALRGDSASQLKWLNTALDTDRKSGEVASELVEASMAIGDYDTAMKALRTLTMMEDPRPITRALAFLKQAEIAVARGDVQRAQHWARKAKSLDENLAEADEFLARISS
jgi:tetratricopeptide (TPR) repeat protein